jgi:hypothetical protein
MLVSSPGDTGASPTWTCMVGADPVGVCPTPPVAPSPLNRGSKQGALGVRGRQQSLCPHLGLSETPKVLKSLPIPTSLQTLVPSLGDRLGEQSFLTPLRAFLHPLLRGLYNKQSRTQPQ